MMNSTHFNISFSHYYMQKHINILLRQNLSNFIFSKIINSNNTSLIDHKHMNYGSLHSSSTRRSYDLHFIALALIDGELLINVSKMKIAIILPSIDARAMKRLPLDEYHNDEFNAL